MGPDTGDAVAEHLKAMRAACRRFLNSVGHDHSARQHVHDLEEGATFGAALGELRAVIGIQLGFMAARYKLELVEHQRVHVTG